MNEYIQADREQQIKELGDSYDNDPDFIRTYRPQDLEESHKAWKFAMKLAVDSLNAQLEVFKKYGKTEIADLVENDIDEITTEVARRELKFL